MTPSCRAPLSDAALLDYWAGDLVADEAERLEEHLFACAACAARLDELAALGAGVAALARLGRTRGVVSRAVLNRLQRDGVRVRMFSLLPGETIPCAVFPGDDLIVAALRADVSHVDAVTVSVTGPGGAPFSRFEDVPVSGTADEVLWATPAALVQEMPSMRLDITLTSAGASPVEIGRYALEHSSSAAPGDDAPRREPKSS